MNHRFTVYTNGQWRTEGRTLKAPCVLMVEGVHNGSGGAIYWPAHVLRNAAPSWDGVPVCIDHPMDEYGRACSFYDSPNGIGMVKNPYFCEAKQGLKAEIHIPITPQIDIEEIKNIREVSVGVFTDETYNSGHWRGEEYHACAITMEPDHLALLPGDVGACSFNDGCGIRNNSRGGNMKKDSIQIMKEAARKGFPFPEIMFHQQGYQELIRKIQAKLDGMDNNNYVHFLEEVFDDGTFIYRVRSSNTEGESQFYKREYNNTDNGVEFEGNPISVVRQVEYVEKTINNNSENFGLFPDYVDDLHQGGPDDDDGLFPDYVDDLHQGGPDDEDGLFPPGVE